MPELTPEPSGELSEVITRAKQELEEMIDLTPVTMVLVDKDGTVVRANRALLRLLGSMGFPEVLGRRLRDLFPAEEEGFFAGMLDVHGGYQVRDVSVALPDGDRTLRFTVLGLGRRTNLRAALVEDVSHEQAEAVDLELKHKREAMRAVTGSLMHSINQPLTVIMVRAQLMLLELGKEDRDIDELRRNLQDIMEFTLQASQTLSRYGDRREYATEPYLDDRDEILSVGDGI